MKRVSLAAVALAVLVGSAVSATAAGDARRTLDEGLALLAARRYDEAAAKFEAAASLAGAEGLDAAVAGYDQGIALLRAGRGAAAAAAFAAAQRATDPRLLEAAHYHRGLALTTAADAAESAGEASKAVALLEEALAAYESAMRIDPGDEDPKVNHELVSRKLRQLAEKMREQEKSAAGRGRSGEAPTGNKAEESGQEHDRKPAQDAPQARQRGAEREMPPDEARTLLDAMRQQELAQRGRTRASRGEVQRVEKDW